MNSSNIEYKNSNKLFARYVSQNILGMIGISAYVLADTYFISVAEGGNGITALNLVLPLYALIYALGALIGVGSATRFKLCRARGDANANILFSNAMIWAFIVSIAFIVVGGIFPNQLIKLLGADDTIAVLGVPYTRIFMLFAPFFMWNYIISAFVRNDGAPGLAMFATVTSSLFNILMDYVLMFPLRMGMVGASLATAFSPIIGILICCIHFLNKNNTITFKWKFPSLTHLVLSAKLGIAAFVGEISSGVITMVFNFIILSLSGNTGVAAYGIVANIAIVATCIFNGISQGSQPLLSEYFGKSKHNIVGHILKLSIISSLTIAASIILTTHIFTSELVNIFNGEGNVLMAKEATRGIHLYFLGYIFAGINIVGSGYLSATENAIWAFITSILRGFVAIITCAFVLSSIWGMTGVWLAFPVSELITMLIMFIGLFKKSGYRN